MQIWNFANMLKISHDNTFYFLRYVYVRYVKICLQTFETTEYVKN